MGLEDDVKDSLVLVLTETSMFDIRTKGLIVVFPSTEVRTFLGFYRFRLLIYQLTKEIVKIFEKQLLLIRGNKLFLCSLSGFHESEHILLNITAKILLS